jgi:hypothetical protein
MKNQYQRPIFDTAEKAPSVYPLNVEFSKKFDLAENAIKNDLLLVFENDTFAGNYKLFINDHKLDKSDIQRQRLYDIWNNTAEIGKYCHLGSNTIRIIWEQAGELDGLKSSIYIKGNLIGQRHRG